MNSSKQIVMVFCAGFFILALLILNTVFLRIPFADPLLFAGAFVYFIAVIARLVKTKETLAGLVERLYTRDYTLPPPSSQTTEREELSIKLKEVILDMGNFAVTLENLTKSMETAKTAFSDTENTAARNFPDSSINTTREISGEKETFFRISSDFRQKIDEIINACGEKNSLQTKNLEDTERELGETVKISGNVADRLTAGSGRMKDLAKNLSEGEEEVQNTCAILKEISKNIEEISEITDSINQISEQTNILSMNAAIESAHAGEAGAGFAVVADEIRKLADSTKENAARIQEGVNLLLKRIKDAQSSSESSSASFKFISGELKENVQYMEETGSLAEAAKSKSREIEGSLADSLRLARETGEETGKIAVAHRSLEDSMKEIEEGSGRTRVETQELSSGSRELLEKMTAFQNQLVQNIILQAEEIKNAMYTSRYDKRGVMVKKAPKTL